jgi:hypothetical protein
LLLRHDLRQRRRLRNAEEHRSAPLDERHDDDVREGKLVDRQRERDAAEGHGPHRVGREHDPLAVQTVDQRARRQVDDEVRHRLGEADDSSLGRRIRQRQDEQRKRESADL